MSELSRRGFIGASGAAAGLAFTTALHGRAYGKGDKIRLGIVGTGARGQQHLKEGLWGGKDFEIVAVADIYAPHLSDGIKLAWLSNAGEQAPLGDRPTPEQMLKLKNVTKPKAYRTHSELLAAEGLDAVVITTPPHTHFSLLAACLDAGKHAFCETPMTTSIPDAREIVAKAHESGRVVQIGHQRRYHPNYNLVAKYLRERLPLGRPTMTESYFHANSHGRFRLRGTPCTISEEGGSLSTDVERHLNWRVYADKNGGPCLDVLPRAIDTTNWICGATPVRVFATGGTDYWKDGRETPDNLSVIFDFRIDSQAAQFIHMDSRYERQDLQSLNRSYLLRGSFSYLLSNCGHREHERIIGDRATSILSPIGDSTYLLESMTDMPYELRKEHLDVLQRGLKEKLAKWPEEERRQFWITRGASYDPPGVFDGPRSNVPITAIGSEESAEVHQFRAFAEHIRNGGTPRANVIVGLAAVIAGESARRSLESGQPVDIDPTLMAFDFETPSISEYDSSAAPIPGTVELM